MKIIIFIVSIIIAGCSNDRNINLDITTDTGIVDFSELVNGSWQKVCFFAPYSYNVTAKSVLGFNWDLENKSSISMSDGITLAVFIENQIVVNYFEISRYTDFASFGGKCFPKKKTRFKVRSGKVTHAPSNV